MSAPQTNIEKQQRRHRGPLVGVVVAVFVALLGLLIWMFAFETEQPGPAGEEGTEQAAPNLTDDPDSATVPAD